MLEIIITEKVNITLTAQRGVVKAWKNEPGDVMAAMNAAYHYAVKEYEPMLVFENNSYMHLVHNIAPMLSNLESVANFSRSSHRMVKVNGKKMTPAVQVNPDGTVMKVLVNR